MEDALKVAADGDTIDSWGPPAPNPPDGLAAQRGLVVGQTRYFQCIYRENPDVLCGTGGNTSNAIAVTFTP